MVRSFSRAALFLAGPAVATALSVSGSGVHCVGDRAHLLKYDVEGDSRNNLEDGRGPLDHVRSVAISMEPSLEHAQQCQGGKLAATPSGDKEFCYGANQDATCDAAQQDLPLQDGLACANCFVGATADVYYKLNYTALALKNIEVGLQNIYLRGGLGVSAHEVPTGVPITGSATLAGDAAYTLIDALVGCPVCVKVKIAVAAPTTATYALTYHGQVDAKAGVGLDIDLGTNYVRWDKEEGWTHPTPSKSVTVKPVLELSASAEADLKLGLQTSLQINVDDIIWYHLNLAPNMPLQLSAKASLTSGVEVCVDGGVDFQLAHEADLHWNILNLWKEFHHWGPTTDFTWSKQDAVHFCKNFPATSDEIIA